MISLSAILKERISISRGMTASSTYTRDYGVAFVVVLSLVLYVHRAYGS